MSQVPNQMNPLLLLALLGEKIIQRSFACYDDDARSILEMQNMLPLILLLMWDDSGSTSETQKSSLEPSLQVKID